MANDPKEIERIVAAYQGGKLCAGDVPIGAKLVVDEAALAAHFKTKGFALSIEEHEDEEALCVVSLRSLSGAQVHVEPAKEG